jgi:hypothetical protein
MILKWILEKKYVNMVWINLAQDKLQLLEFWTRKWKLGCHIRWYLLNETDNYQLDKRTLSHCFGQLTTLRKSDIPNRNVSTSSPKWTTFYSVTATMKLGQIEWIKQLPILPYIKTRTSRRSRDPTETSESGRLCVVDQTSKICEPMFNDADS